MTPSQADAIWTVLVECCGARESHRETFIRCMQGVEYRVGGSLGFGGKLYVDRQGCRVSCYREDETPERRAAIDAANVRLKALWERERGK